MTHPPALWSLASYTGVAALLFQPDPQFYVLCGVVITSAASIISLRISARNARDDAERRHQWEREDREEFRRSLRTDIKQVATIAAETKQGIEKLNPPSV